MRGLAEVVDAAVDVDDVVVVGVVIFVIDAADAGIEEEVKGAGGVAEG